MLTWEEDVQAHALRERGWSITAIAAHLGRDRKTIRAYLSGQRIPGQRRPAGEDHFADYDRYVRARFRDDAHVQLSALFDEVVALGYPRSYQTFTRVVRERGLRPSCVSCDGVTTRATVDIDHPAGEECQWDWVQLPGAPWLAAGEQAHLLVGVLAFSSQARACFADAEDQPHLIAGLDGVSRRLGGTPRRWRFDRMSTVVYAGSDRVLPSFAAVAKHYGVEVVVCPAYRANRKGAVEKANDLIAQRWWRTAEVATPAQAQASLDAFLVRVGDARTRTHAGRRTTVAELARLEVLRALPERAFPAEVTRTGVVARDATVAFDGNRYGVTPSLIGVEVTVASRLGSDVVRITTPAGLVVATHARAASGAGAIVRTPRQRAALEQVVLAAAAGGGRPCRRKTHRPPGEDAKTEADRLRRRQVGGDDEVVIDLGVYADHVDATTHPRPTLIDPCGCLGGATRLSSGDDDEGARR